MDIYDTRWCGACQSLVGMYLLGDRQFECAACGSTAVNPPAWDPEVPE